MPFKQAFRLAFVTLIWKQYKGLIVSTLLLFFYLYLVGSLHGDFLAHAKLNADTSGVGLSFVYKWAALATGVLSYFAFHYFRTNKRKQKNKLKKSKDRQAELAQELSALEDEDDPFNAIRKRKTLRSRADFIIEDKEH